MRRGSRRTYLSTFLLSRVFLSLPFRIFNDRLLQLEGGEVDVVNGGAKVFEELGKSDFDARGGIHPA